MSATPGIDPTDPRHNAGISFVPSLHHTAQPSCDPTTYSLPFPFTVLISGGNKGVGHAVAVGYAKAGASTIILVCRTAPSQSNLDDIHKGAKEAGRTDAKVTVIDGVDITSQTSVEAAAAKVKEQGISSIDVLVNNAGYLGRFEKLLDGDVDDWWSNWTVNIRGTYLASRAFLPIVLKSAQKTIINITSAGAHHIFPGASGYQTTKLAIMRFSEFLMADYGGQGLLSYSVHPGGVKTDLARNMPTDAAARILIDEPEVPGEMIPWLTKERRDWLAGRYVDCRWDVTELIGRKEEIVKGDLLKVRMAVALGS